VTEKDVEEMGYNNCHDDGIITRAADPAGVVAQRQAKKSQEVDTTAILLRSIVYQRA